MWLLRFIAVTLGTLACLLSCTKAPARFGGTEQPKSNSQLVWQTAWVDPRIVESDTVLTLFQAGRIDSLQIAQDRAEEQSADAVEFRISRTTCEVEVNLLDSGYRLVRHLMSRTLSTGYYKLTINPGAARRLNIAPGDYQLSVRYCRKGVSGKVAVK